jgi:DNA-binding IclR family transcriptional regulator
MKHSMEEKRKYWVPALEKAHLVLQAVSEQPGHYKLIDLSKHLGINKSSLFSMLLTMEELHWVTRDADGTYALGGAFAGFGASFIRHFDLGDAFHREAVVTRDRLGETIQMAKLVGTNILYLGKLEAPSPVRLLSEPGMRLPAHCTAMGKALLASMPNDEVSTLFDSTPLTSMTIHTVSHLSELLPQLEQIRQQGYAEDLQEAVMGFSCVAAPVFNRAGKAICAVSCSMPVHQWESRALDARKEIIELAGRLSNLQ